MPGTGTESISPSSRSKRWDRRLDWVVPGGFAVYLGLHVILRLALSPGAELDEAEQLVLTQGFAWVYGSQPPLYTWLQQAVFAWTGPGIPGLALLKNTLLFGTYAGIYFLAASVSGSRRRGALAAVMVLLIPQIVWESQRDLTHSVLVTTSCVWTLVALRWLEFRPTPTRFALFGLVTGIGFLSKYNYALFWVALVGALLATRHFRETLVRPTASLVPLVALAVAAPHLWFASRNPGLVTADAEKFGAGAAPGLWPGVLEGWGNLVLAAVAYLGPLLLVGVVLFVATRGRPPPAEGAPWRKILFRTAGFALGLCALLAIFAGVTEFKDRWMQPLLFFAPVWLVLLLPGEVPSGLLRFAAGTAVVVGLTVLALTWGRTRIAADSRLNEPFPALAQGIRAQGHDPSAILGADRFIAGNLRLRFPGAIVFSPETPVRKVPKTSAILVAWKPRDDGLTAAKLRTFVERRFPAHRFPAEATTLTLPLRHSANETSSFSIGLLEPKAVHE